MSIAILMDSSGNVEVDYPLKVWSVSRCLSYSYIAVINTMTKATYRRNSYLGLKVSEGEVMIS